MATEQLTEYVADGLEGASKVVRSYGASHLVMFLGIGLVAGATAGFVVGYRWNREKIRAEEFEKSKEEVAAIREAYFGGDKDAPPLATDKPALEDVVEERGYSVEEPERPTRPPVPVQPPRDLTPEQKRAVEEVRQGARDLDNALAWDYAKEVAKRSKNHPYVIHQEEYNQNRDEYQQLTWTYYASDNILADEQDEMVTRPELIVGIDSLQKFGHGSDDANVVFVRNEKLEIEFEVCRLFKSYAVEVQGLDEHDETNETQTDETRPGL